MYFSSRKVKIAIKLYKLDIKIHEKLGLFIKIKIVRYQLEM
jgi:hypothetical protein